MTFNLKRTFIAIRMVPDQIFLSEYDFLRKELNHENIRWIKEENLHITITFIGDISIKDIKKVSLLLGEIVTNLRSFNFKLKGINVFRNIVNPRVLWIGIDNSEYLSQIKNQLDTKLQSIVKFSETGNYNPHLTIGRMKKINNPEILKTLINKYQDHEFCEVNISELLFYESIPGKDGPLYKILSAHEFPY